MTHQDVQDELALLRTAVVVRAFGAVGTAVPSGTVTAVAFDSESFDPLGFHDNTTNNTRLTVPAGYGGLYVILGQIAYPSLAATDLHNILRKNAVTDLAEGQVQGTASTATKVPAYTMEQLVAGDYITMSAYQSTGGSTTTQADRTVTYLTMVRVGA